MDFAPDEQVTSASPFRVIRRAISGWWTDWLFFASINLVWVFCVLTVILGPPATVGMVAAANRTAHGYKPAWRDVTGAARRYALQSWVWALLNAGAGFAIVFAMRTLSATQTEIAFIPMALIVGLGALWVIVQLYTLPYLLEQEHPNVLQALRNALFTVLASPLYTLVLVIVTVLIGVLSGVLVALLFLGGPALIAVVACSAVAERVQTFGVRARDAERHARTED